MAHDDNDDPKGSFTISPQLATIGQWNPGVRLSNDDVRLANAGDLVLVGLGSTLQTGNFAGTFVDPSFVSVRRGCIDWLRYQNKSSELTAFSMDGNLYSGGNINDFRERIEDAAFHMKKINFCWYPRERRMTMLNIYPQQCCRCTDAPD